MHCARGTLLKRYFSLGLLCILAACSAQRQQQPSATAAKAVQAARPFPADTLYALLAAEMAIDRGQMDVALANYLQQAYQSRDLGVVRRAALLADYLRDEQAALAAATLWSTLDPGDAEPRYIMGRYQLATQQIDQALESSKRLLSMDAQTLFVPIAASPESDQQRKSLLADYRRMLQSHPKSVDLLLGTALLLAQGNDYSESLRYLAKAQSLDEQNIQARLFEVDILYKSGRQDQAIKKLAAMVEDNRDNANLRLQYARLLATIDLRKAREQFDYLARTNPLDPGLLLARALVNYKLNDFVQATDLFEQLLFLKQHPNISHYYLGEIARAANQQSNALEHYRRVEPGSSEYLPAAAQAFNLMLLQNRGLEGQKWLMEQRNLHPQQAMRLYLVEADVLLKRGDTARSLAALNTAIKAYPEGMSLYYARSLLLDKTGDKKAAKEDLMRVLMAQPNNVDALNSLGYMLAVSGRNLDEAHKLVSRALALRPDDASILDSMGWVLFKQGKYEEAILRLRHAYKLSKSDEIAAHLGEALWTVGNKKEAAEIWAQAIQQEPGSEPVREAQKRLGIR